MDCQAPPGVGFDPQILRKTLYSEQEAIRKRGWYMSIGSKRKAFTMTMMRHLSAALVVMGFTWLCALPPAAAGEPGASSEPRFVAVTIQGQSCLVKRDGDGETLFESSKALAAIEWALNHSRIVVLKGGTFNVAGTLNIPRPNVTLIIAGDATLQAADKAELDIVSAEDRVTPGFRI